ncbi:MAG: polysaccharide biosynthesis C-terminal domain-containing protein [Chitinophagaceae bacterium]|nr:polysaccharide biosynthesis C-terminal domain-containing protein [Chitinophagaceae bacterium]
MKTDLFKGSIYRIIFMGLSFLVGLLIAAISGTAIFGSLSLMIVNAAMLLIFSGLGTDAALVWHWAGEKLNPRAGYSFVTLSGLVQLLLFGMGEWVSLQVWDETLLARGSAQIYLWPETLYFVGLVLLEKWGSLFYATHKAVRANQVLASISFVFALFLAFSIQGIGIRVDDPFSLFAGFTFIQGLSLMVAFHMSVPGIRPGRLSRREIRSLFQFSFLVFITNGIQFLAYRIDYWFIDYYQGEAGVGVYAQANRFAQLMWVVPNILAALLIPVLSRKEGAMKTPEFMTYPRFLMRWNALLLLLVPFTAWLIYQYLMPASFMPGWKALLWMIPGYYFFGLTLLLAAWFSAMGHLKVNLTGSLICLVLIIVADASLIPRWGAMGAALANTLAYSLTTLYFMLRFKARTGIDHLSYWRSKD